MNGHADAVSAASLFHYRFAKEYEPEPRDYLAEGNIEFLRNPELRKHGFRNVRDATIPQVKTLLQLYGIASRPVQKRADDSRAASTSVEREQSKEAVRA